MSYQGDINLEQTLRFTFTSRRFSTGAPHTLAGSPSLAVYEDGSLTQITAGLTLTVDFDGVTGLNHVAVAATAANGFEAGKDYSVVIAAGTVDSVSVVGEVLATFSIENRNREANLTEIGGAAVNTSAAQLGVNVVQAAGTAWGSGAISAPVIATDAITNAKLAANCFTSSELDGTAVAEIWNYVTRSLTDKAGFTIAGTITTLDALDTAQDSQHATTQAAVAALNNLSTADIDARLAVYDAPTKAEMDAAFTEIKGATWSAPTDTLEAIRDRGDAAWATATGFATEAKQDVIDGVVDAIKAVTDNLPESGALTTLLANVAAILDDTGTDGVAISAATREAIAASLLDLADGVEANLTVRQQLRLASSALFSLCSGMGTTSGAFRDFNNTKNRIEVTIDADGNRTAFATRDAT